MTESKSRSNTTTTRHSRRWKELRKRLEDSVKENERFIQKFLLECVNTSAPFPFSHFEKNAIEVLNHRAYDTADRCVLELMDEIEEEIR